jgi:hypothetical protein
LNAKGVLALTACYVALSEDLTPLLDPHASDVAGASPPCAVHGELRPEARDVHPASTLQVDMQPSARKN